MPGSNSYKSVLMLYGWDDVRKKVPKGIKRLGHDIPITGYGSDGQIGEAGREKEKDKRRQAG